MVRVLAQRRLLLDGLDMERNLHPVADDHAAGLEHGVVVETKLLAVNNRLGRKPEALFSVEPGRPALDLGIERDLSGDVADREVAKDPPALVVDFLHLLARERNRRELTCGQEVL